MAENTKIEWTEATWNPWHGCHKVSQGCKNCYMFREKRQYGQDPNVVVRSKTKFYDPLKWKEPRTIFTCSWSDFFIEEADPWRVEAFAIMALTPQHTYQVLTKRPDRMLEYLTADSIWSRIALKMGQIAAASKNRDVMERGDEITRNFPLSTVHFQLPNVWLGVSVEDQATADERIPLLLQTPAALRWLSIEPLLGPVDLGRHSSGSGWDEWLTGRMHRGPGVWNGEPKIDWAVVGGESGPDARPMHPNWARSLRDQCTAASVPFFFKQWGEYWPFDPLLMDIHPFGDVPKNWSPKLEYHWALENPQPHRSVGNDYISIKLGKQKAGRILDGRTWDEMPEVSR